MTERRVRPNGLVVGGSHPPIFTELLNQRRVTADIFWGEWSYPVYGQRGAVAQLARKIAFEENEVKRPLFTFSEVVHPRFGEYGLSLNIDEGDDRL